MPERDDLLIGHIALERGWITPEQFGAALEEAQRRSSSGDTVKAAPRSFGKFVLEKQVGVGGFGAVYKAHQRDLGRTVALKFLHSEDPDDMQRFVREAQTAAKLTHPHIVPLYEIGEHEGKPYLAMEFIDGQTLNKLRLEPRKALEIMRDVAGAVAYAHEKGIVHRDIKPQNLMLSGDHVWVMDFGLARQLKGGTTLTMSGAVVGTPAYMPPEQAEGKRCDARSDVYSLGATLFELVTGHPPFEGPEPLAILDKVRSEDPIPPRQYDPKLDREVETLIAKAMEKEPSRRYASAPEFAEDLRRHLAGEPILAKPSSVASKAVKWVKRHMAWSAAAAVLLTGALVLSTVLAARELQFRAKLRDLLDRAATAEGEGRFGDAEDLYKEVKTLQPAHPTAADRAIEMRAAAEAAARRLKAAEWVKDGRSDRRRFEEERDKLLRQRGERKRLAGSIPTWEPDKRKLWELDQAIEATEGQEAAHYATMISDFIAALGVDSGNREAHSALEEVYFAELVKAESENDPRGIRLNETMLMLFGDGSHGYRLFLSPPAVEGTITLDSNPTGAEVELLRYEEGPDRRLVARPVRSLGTCPIAATNLPRGSYLLILRKPGFRDVRYPVAIGRGTQWSGRVNLYAENEIGRDFIYIPGGPFVMGRDKEAYGAFDPEMETAPREIGDFFIGRYEVTCEEYRSFIEDLAKTDLAMARQRVPRSPTASGAFWLVDDAGKVTYRDPGMALLPAMGVSWDDAHAYAEWRSRREGKNYRLSTSAEWEKAARGVDGRYYPWGNHFDWSFASGGQSKGGRRVPDRMGEFEKDESPYGVRDMGGSLREWCEDAPFDFPNSRFARGGTWGGSDVADFRTVSRYWSAPSFVISYVGFRLLRVPPRR